MNKKGIPAQGCLFYLTSITKFQHLMAIKQIVELPWEPIPFFSQMPKEAVEEQ
jgi:hypothetical protein